MRTHNWTTILTVIVPYLHLLKGDKFLGMMKLVSLHKLQYATTFKDALHAVRLGHNLSKAATAFRHVSLSDKTLPGKEMLALYPGVTNYITPDFSALYVQSSHPLSFLFIVGFS